LENVPAGSHFDARKAGWFVSATVNARDSTWIESALELCKLRGEAAPRFKSKNKMVAYVVLAFWWGGCFSPEPGLVKPAAAATRSAVYAPDPRVATFFAQHFGALDDGLRTKRPLTLADSYFVYLIGYLSGIYTDIESYSGVPLLKKRDVVAYRRWYRKHQAQICWGHLEEMEGILQSQSLSDEQLARLESFKM
jgi:hypothetical protein